MKNVNQLEKERREVLRNMKEEEIKKLYENLSEEYISYHWSFKNNFTGNLEEIDKINKRFLELDSDLKGRYKTDVLYFSSMTKSLRKEVDEVNTEVLRLQIKNDSFEFINWINLFEHELFLLRILLDEYYVKYHFKYSFGNSYKLIDYIEDKFSLDMNKEEDLDIISYFNEKSEEIDKEHNEKRFKRTERDFNFYIKTLVEFIEKCLNQINPFLKMDYEITENTIEELVPIIKSFIEIQGIAKTLIENYEELIANPFKESIEGVVKIQVESFNKLDEGLEYSLKLDYDEELAIAMANAPKYDFEKFELIDNKE